ncbi:hypothetical protein C3E98_015845 [Pseudomonas sp. MWU13-2625]|nr:hypothetical protein C3E98_015845 [Pseudomonas sp. MWU13-2625]
MNPSTQPADGAGTARSRAAAELALILLSGEKHVVGFCFSVGASLLAMAALQPTNFQLNAFNPCGSWLASDGGLTADQSPIACTQSTVGASLLAMAALQPTNL